MDTTKHASYLTIALAQRQRAAKQAEERYGIASAVTAELSKDCIELQTAIADLKQGKSLWPEPEKAKR